MKKIILTLLLVCTALFSAEAQSVTGLWKTIDDNSGKVKSIVEIYEKDGKIYGKVKEILDPDAPKDAVCQNCPGDDDGKPIIGLTFIKGLKKDGDEYNDGKILDPESGELYKCYIKLEDEDTLKVRGYIGFALLGRTQYWQRVK